MPFTILGPPTDARVLLLAREPADEVMPAPIPPTVLGFVIEPVDEVMPGPILAKAETREFCLDRFEFCLENILSSLLACEPSALSCTTTFGSLWTVGMSACFAAWQHGEQPLSAKQTGGFKAPKETTHWVLSPFSPLAQTWEQWARPMASKEPVHA